MIGWGPPSGGPFFMIFYGLVYKEDFIEGEWLDEPDLEVWDPGHSNLLCIIRRHTGGHLCGYVGINNTVTSLVSQLAAHCYDLDCHGGLTFRGHDVVDDLLQGGEYSWTKSYYYVGFDCAHVGDLCFLRKDIGGIRMKIFENETYKNWDYVKEQCQSLAHQIHALMTSQVG